MSEADIYIKKGLNIIKGYLNSNNLAAALKGCQELYSINPYDDGVRSMYKKVQALVLEDNSRRVDQDIASTMPLWNEKKFAELGVIYKKLSAFAPTHAHLKEMILKLNIAMQHEQEGQRLAFIDKAVSAIHELIKQKKYRDAVGGSRELVKLAPLNSTAIALLKRTTKALIDDELEKNQRIVEGGDFDRSVEFLRSLLSIDSENSKLISLQKRALSHLNDQNKVSGKIAINESEQRLKDLYKSAEYEKVVQACNEIFLAEPGNIAAKIYKSKAERSLESESSKIILNKMLSKDYKSSIAEEMSINKDRFLVV